MGRVIYVYLNDDDLMNILGILSEKGMCFYDKDKLPVDSVKAVSNDIVTFYFGYNRNHFIEFSPCFYTLKYLQPAAFRIKNTDDSILNNTFSLVKKYIRQVYMLSTDKSYYIGTNIYQDWLNKKYYFPTLFQYEEVVIDEEKLENLFERLSKEGYRIRQNDVRLRNIDVPDFSAESFVIYDELSKLLTTIKRKSIISYEYGSDCIFVYRRKKIKKCVFWLDRRIADDSTSRASIIFKNLEKLIK